MTTFRVSHLALCLALLAAPALADEKKPTDMAGMPPMSAEMQKKMAAYQASFTPGKEQAQLAEQFQGNWTAKTTMWMDASTPPMTSAGTANTTVEFGGRQVKSLYKGEFMGQPFEGVGMVGYDNTQKMYVNHWVDSMGTGQYLTMGTYDTATRTYTFKGEMADPSEGGKKFPTRDTVQIVDKDHHVMESFETRDGKERKMMRIEYARAD